MDSSETGITDDVDIDDDVFSDGLSVMLHFSNTGNSHPRKAQLSMVFVGVREYSQPVYPLQALFVDDFKFNAIYSERNQNVDIDLDTDAIFEDTPSMFNTFYHDTTAEETSHVFCGFYDIQFRSTTQVIGDIFGFTTDYINIEDFIISFQRANPSEVRIMDYGYECDLFTSKNPCVESTSIMAVDPTFIPSVDSSDASFQSNFATGVPDGANDYDG